MRLLCRARLTLAVTGAVLLGSALPALAAKRPPGDPPGNNGTIKVVASDPSDPDPGNEPQLGSCRLWLEFYGFDQGQVADIVFTAQPPTGTGQELLRYTGTISDDAAGGGQDDDAVLAFNLSSALQGIEPHPQQGYHVKVASNSQTAPGGAKQKVLWMTCAPEPPGSIVVTKATEGTAPEGASFAFDLSCDHTPMDRVFGLRAGESTRVDGVPAGTLCLVTETDTGGGTVRMTEDGRVVVASGQVSTVGVTNLFGDAAVVAAGSAAPPGVGPMVAGASETHPAPATATPAEVLPADALPRTGVDPLGSLGVATLLMAAGGLAWAAARRMKGASGT